VIERARTAVTGAASGLFLVSKILSGCDLRARNAHRPNRPDGGLVRAGTRKIGPAGGKRRYVPVLGRLQGPEQTSHGLLSPMSVALRNSSSMTEEGP